MVSGLKLFPSVNISPNRYPRDFIAVAARYRYCLALHANARAGYVGAARFAELPSYLHRNFHVVSHADFA